MDDTQCPNCGSRDIGKTVQHGFYYRTYPSYRGGTRSSAVDDEVHMYSCRTCGHVWQRRPYTVPAHQRSTLRNYRTIKNWEIVVGIFAVFILVFIVYSLYLQPAREAELIHLEYRNYEYGFGLNPSVHFSPLEDHMTEYDSGLFILSFSRRIQEKGSNITLYVTRPVVIREDVTLTMFAHVWLEEYTVSYDNFSVLSEEDTVINGMDVHVVVAQFSRDNCINSITQEHYDEPVMFQQKYVFFEHDRRIICFICEVVQSGYEDWIDGFDGCIDSLKMI
ncbi:MAG: hypothetical protein JW779_15705 [Candidatus Thorarchaeota archaeon]|nr:hypothetical protein [Candidatus Thorarchaeota archaeon]